MSLCPPTLRRACSRKVVAARGRCPVTTLGGSLRLLVVSLLIWSLLAAAEPMQQTPAGDEIPLTLGRSVVLDHPDDIRRVAITDDAIADAVAISTREILINAKRAGLTSMILWSTSGERNFFTITVSMNVEQVQNHIRLAFPGENVLLTASKGIVTLEGKVSSPDIADRVLAMVSADSQATIINNLEVPPPPPERQILLKVRFASVDRSAMSEFGVALMSTGAFNTPATISTQQFGGGRLTNISGTIPPELGGTNTGFTFQDVLNVFAFRPDLNIATLIKALKSKGLIEILAEPNIIATSGKEASFLVGGEFPVPVVQGGATAGAITIQFREFGIRLDFLPEFTARGSIKMHVVPEVSALDFANAATIVGFVIPALTTRRVSTDVELMPGQSFVIGGLIDNRMTETVSRIPGLSSIPLIGTIFKSRSKDRQNTELMVLVTPEFPTVIEAGEEKPLLPMPGDFMEPLAEYTEKWREQKRK